MNARQRATSVERMPHDREAGVAGDATAFAQLVARTAARLRHLCPALPDDAFAALVLDAAQFHHRWLDHTTSASRVTPIDAGPMIAPRQPAAERAVPAPYPDRLGVTG